MSCNPRFHKTWLFAGQPAEFPLPESGKGRESSSGSRVVVSHPLAGCTAPAESKNQLLGLGGGSCGCWASPWVRYSVVAPGQLHPRCPGTEGRVVGTGEACRGSVSLPSRKSRFRIGGSSSQSCRLPARFPLAEPVVPQEQQQQGPARRGRVPWPGAVAACELRSELARFAPLLLSLETGQAQGSCSGGAWMGLQASAGLGSKAAAAWSNAACADGSRAAQTPPAGADPRTTVSG